MPDLTTDAEIPVDQRLTRFADHLRAAGYHVQDDTDAARWLAHAVENTGLGLRTFDTSTGVVVNRTYDDGLSGAVLDDTDRRQRNGAPVSQPAVDHLQVVGRIAGDRQAVLDRPAASVLDTTDGRAVAELNPWRRDFQEHVLRLDDPALTAYTDVDENGTTFGERLATALALQHAADGRAEIARHAAPDEYLDTRAPYPDVPSDLVRDRSALEDRQAAGKLPDGRATASLDRANRLTGTVNVAAVDRMLNPRHAARPQPRTRAWRLGGAGRRERELQQRLADRTSELDQRLAAAAEQANRSSRWAEQVDALPVVPAGTPEERFGEFAAYLRGRGFDVRTPAQALGYLEDGRRWTSRGQRWFDTSGQNTWVRRDPVYLAGPVGDRITDGMQRAHDYGPNVPTNRAMVKVVKEMQDVGVHVDGGVPLRITDTPDGRAINRLRLNDHETKAYLERLKNDDPAAHAILDRYGTAQRFVNRVHDSLALQFAVDTRAALSRSSAAVGVSEVGTRLDPEVGRDRAQLESLHIHRANDRYLGVSPVDRDAMATLDKLPAAVRDRYPPWYSWEGDQQGRYDYRAADREIQAVQLNRRRDAVAERTGGPRLTDDETRPGMPTDPARMFPPPGTAAAHPPTHTQPLPHRRPGTPARTTAAAARPRAHRRDEPGRPARPHAHEPRTP